VRREALNFLLTKKREKGVEESFAIQIESFSLFPSNPFGINSLFIVASNISSTENFYFLSLSPFSPIIPVIKYRE
jgi:hypothetical protein